MAILKYFEIYHSDRVYPYRYLPPVGVVALSAEDAMREWIDEHPEILIDSITISFKGYVASVSEAAKALISSFNGIDAGGVEDMQPPQHRT